MSIGILEDLTRLWPSDDKLADISAGELLLAGD
jgi:hypothetical protein